MRPSNSHPRLRRSIDAERTPMPTVAARQTGAPNAAKDGRHDDADDRHHASALKPRSQRSKTQCWCRARHQRDTRPRPGLSSSAGAGLPTGKGGKHIRHGKVLQTLSGCALPSNTPPSGSQAGGQDRERDRHGAAGRCAGRFDGDAEPDAGNLRPCRAPTATDRLGGWALIMALVGLVIGAVAWPSALIAETTTSVQRPPNRARVCVGCPSYRPRGHRRLLLPRRAGVPDRVDALLCVRVDSGRGPPVAPCRERLAASPGPA